MGDFMENDVSDHLSLKTWGKILPYLKPLKGRAAFVLTMMLLSAGVDAMIPLFSRHAVDNFVVPQTTDGLTPFVLVYLGVILFQALTTVLYTRQSMIIDTHMARAMRSDCFLHLQKLPLSFYNTTSVGYILARVMSDTGRISDRVAWMCAGMFWHIFYLIGIIASMFMLNVKMALIVMCVLPFIVGATVIFQPKMLAANRRARKANSAITSSFNENVTGAKTSKTLVIEDKNSAEFAGITKEMYDASLRSVKLRAIFLPIVTFCTSVSVALVLYFSGSDVMDGTLNLGMLSAFIAYAIAILEPISDVARFISELMATQVNIERVTALLAEPLTIADAPEIEERDGGIFDPKPENWPDIKGDIEFEHVWFRYPDAPEDDYVLEDVNLKIPAGASVAIVGETGAGKSTLVNLACRFYEPTKGRILIDGADYRERGQIWLRSSLGYVGQSPHLFSGSLKDNLRYGKLDATDAEIERALKLSHADSVANKLENGYDTDVGEGGDRLSTGEKQLVSLGRAIIADPPIFVLDEATSSVDTETEALIQNAIFNVLEGRTSFIIAHRLSTIRNADLILLVEGHDIVERGSHEELMALRGRYHKLYTAMMIKDESEHAGFAL